ncbi:hypothetical protein HPB52_021864 [Rhipicephalus sanguineus]|uniref:Tick transposon n=1 Tax=Rhipicephalus sanguineus TaxID=34632 RepID=A0A9D4PIP7_RHISA|nr:hypothetical protein HPB52_021864 [Rhipicephalus sanguineus]
MDAKDEWPRRQEAYSKVAFEARLRRLGDSRWARRIFRYLSLTGIRTQWSNRVHRLRGKFEFFAETDSGTPEGLTPHSVRTRVREVENAQWRSGVLRKSTLRMYGEHKTSARTEKFHDNSVGSALLFEARAGASVFRLAGALRTLTYLHRFDEAPEVQAAICRCCAETSETAEHINNGLCPSLSTPSRGHHHRRSDLHQQRKTTMPLPTKLRCTMEPPLSVVLRFGFRPISGVAEFFRPHNLRKGKKLVNAK